VSIRKLDEAGAEAGGVVVITAFACRTRTDVLLLWWLHHRLDARVRAATDKFLGVKLYIDWSDRRVRSVSLWSDIKGLYDMGKVEAHIAATRLPAQRGITTSCGVYGYRGDWRTVLFGEGYATPAPLQTSEHDRSTN